ncbi:discoidin domain-containing protein [Brevundimonas sp.]|uniref:galactose-binding domain-containing protein n=1 Tax=Brevundimonas sp. TaxID=1871086 RepID=UPI0026325258|nr:discoidin domain-containing protein [Brevundimonas sp.]
MQSIRRLQTVFQRASARSPIGILAASLGLGAALLSGPSAQAQVAETYVYDAQGRLTGSSQTNPTGNTSWSGYNFDSANNITARSNLSVALPALSYRLQAGEYLVRRQTLTSPVGNVTLSFQADGDVVLRCGTTPVWSTGTFGTQALFLTMQGDGHLVLYGPNYSVIWFSGVFGFSNAFLNVQNDGNLVVYDPSGPRWSTNTSCSSGGEITAITYTASSSWASYTGLTTPNGMRDGDYFASSSVHGTDWEADATIQADLGLSRTVSRIDLATIDFTAGGWGPAYLNNAIVEHSINGATWTNAGTVSGMVDGSYKSINLGGASMRYIRLRMVNNWLGVGDFRVYQ